MAVAPSQIDQSLNGTESQLMSIIKKIGGEIEEEGIEIKENKIQATVSNEITVKKMMIGLQNK